MRSSKFLFLITAIVTGFVWICYGCYEIDLGILFYDYREDYRIGDVFCICCVYLQGKL